MSEARSLTATWGARLLRVRWIVRAPVGLYRARLGFVFGSRLLMLEHTGRRSGAARYVVLEVVDTPSPNVRVVVSGFGELRTRGLRNVRANPRVRIYVGGHRPVPAVAHELDATERRAALSALRAAASSLLEAVAPGPGRNLGNADRRGWDRVADGRPHLENGGARSR